MKAKKFVFWLLILSIFAAHSLAAQEAKDVVLVVDTSASMFSYYNEVSTFLTGPFLAENLGLGDTLHIISYASRPRFEIARRVSGQGDIETVSGRIWLLYPLEANSDPGGALNYAEQYARSLPGGRGKKVFVVSDDDAAEALSASAADRLKPSGTDLIFIRASRNIRNPGRGQVASNQAANRPPANNQPSSTPSGNTAQSGTGPGGTAARTDTGSASTGTGAGTGANTGTGASSGAGTNNAADTTGTGAGATGAASGIANIGDNSTVEETNDNTGTNLITDTNPDNSGQITETVPETSGGTTNDNRGTPPATRQSGTTASSQFNPSSIPLPVLLGLLLLLLILIIFLVTRRLNSSPNKSVASSTDDSAARNAELLNSFASSQAAAALQGTRRSQYRDPGSFPTNPPMLNLFVEEQNTAIGRRNVHSLKKGSTYSVGGGASDFLIFLVPVPYRLGEVYFDGNNCTFTPLKPKYFPDLGSTQVHECIGKTIRILSDKNYEVFFHFERYRDPLIALNQLLHSIQVPEPPAGQKEKEE